VEQKKRLVSALKADVSPEAQNLFMTIAKTINNNEVTWQGKNIVVFNDVMIKPPYKTGKNHLFRPTNCSWRKLSNFDLFCVVLLVLFGPI
jgi:hypothetical protein